jgi:hypothetical protein
MENKNGFWFRAAIRAVVVLAVVGYVPLTWAKGPSPVITPAGKGFQIKYASDGTPLAVMSNTATGVKVVANTPLPVSATTVVPVVVTGAIAGGQIFGPVGAMIGAIGGLAIASTPALLEMAARAKLRVKADGSLEMKNSNVCDVGPCYQYQISDYNGNFGPWFSTPQGACGWGSSTGLDSYTYTTSGGPGGQCIFWAVTKNVSRQEVDPQPAAYVPVTTAEAATAISLNAPTSAEVQALYDAGFPPEIPAPVITGPARVFTGNTVELLSPNERRLTEEWKNLDYSTPGEVKVQTEKKVTVTSDPKTTTTTTLNPDGTTTTSTTTEPATTKTETRTDDEELDPKDPCKGFVNRLGCMDIDTPSADIPKSSKTIAYQEESVFGAGSCPVNLTANVSTLGHSVTVWDWQKTCAMALPLRALVLALATFAALLIVMPGKVET